MAPARLRAVVVSAGVLLAGCAGDDDGGPQSTSTTVADVLNRNDRSTALGRLCWVRRELVLGLDDVLAAAPASGPGDPARFDRGLGRMRQAAGQAAADLAPDPSLPGPAVPFRDALADAVARARPVLESVPPGPPVSTATEVHSALAPVLSFATFPGFRAYVDTAAADASACPDP